MGGVATWSSLCVYVFVYIFRLLSDPLWLQQNAQNITILNVFVLILAILYRYNTANKHYNEMSSAIRSEGENRTNILYGAWV